MKDRILFITNTYFQLITSIQIRRELFADCDADIVVTNHSLGYERVASNLEKSNIFEKVFVCIDRDDVRDDSFAKKCLRYLKGKVNPTGELSQYLSLPNEYNIVLFNNPTILVHLLERVMGKKTKFYRFEEGYSTYTRPLFENKYKHMLIKLFYGDLGRKVERLYLYHPELFTRSDGPEIIKIPLINREPEFVKSINDIFEYNSGMLSLPYKFIFFEESFRTKQEYKEDIYLIEEIADIVGRDKIAVKRHPRSPENFELGDDIAMFDAAGIPWEVMVLNDDVADKVLLTITSGSVLASHLYFENKDEVVMLFNCLENKPPLFSKTYHEYILNIADNNEHFHIPDSKLEMQRLLCDFA